MSEHTAIEWCDSTFNPWIGCTKVSPACDDCYAARSTPARTMQIAWGPGQPRRRTAPASWKQPLLWNRQRFMQCHACGWRGPLAAELIGCGRCGSTDHLGDVRRRVFCASLADVFDNEVDPAWRVDLFRLIADTPNLDWLLLTKRIGNVANMLGDYRTVPLLPNVWLGATVVNQQEADRDIPKLLAVPARVRFLSIEPMLEGIWVQPYLSPHCKRHKGKLDADGKCEVCEGRGIWDTGATLAANDKAATRSGIDWVICGGESGPKARPMHPDWARSLRDQCEAARVPFLFKQWGEWIEPDIYGNNARLTVREGDPEFESAAAVMDGFLCADGRFAASLDDMAPDTRYLGMVRAGKKAAGRLLDGCEHNGFPEVR